MHKPSASFLCVFLSAGRYEYKMAREYNWNVKNKATKGYEVRKKIKRFYLKASWQIQVWKDWIEDSKKLGYFEHWIFVRKRPFPMLALASFWE